jgi:prepilin signal peptidase PulO-like enzyme (type II secretory pathway)
MKLLQIVTVLSIFLFYISLYFLSRRNFGLGDVKLSLPLAIALVTIDTKMAISSNIIAFYLAGFYALYKYFKGARRTYIAFGPFMLIGFWTATLLPLTISEKIVNLWVP